MKLLFILLTACFSLSAFAQVSADTACQKVRLTTSMGEIVIALSDKTPLHRDNFISHVTHGDYDGVLFHRVISDFMIQTGNPSTRPKEVKSGHPALKTKKVPAEFRFPELFHRKGAVAAAREADEDNPRRESSSTQFYIVFGEVRTDKELDQIQNRISERTNGEVVLTPEVREVYRQIGGTPHLDGQYTVFGQVVSGMEVVDAIEKVKTDDHDKPLEDIRILKAELIK